MFRAPDFFCGIALQIDLRRAIQEKVLALDMLASAEKRMIEKESAYGKHLALSFASESFCTAL